jgi:hypothetical protein
MLIGKLTHQFVKALLLYMLLYSMTTVLWRDIMLWACSMYRTFAYIGMPPNPFSRPRDALPEPADVEPAKDTLPGTVAKKPEQKLLGCNF